MALVLTRRVGEVIIIGDNISVTVLEITPSRGRVRLGIAAPREVPVHRKEYLDELNERRLREGEIEPSP